MGCVFMHLPDHFFGKCTTLHTQPQQHGRLYLFHNFKQRCPVILPTCVGYLVFCELVTTSGSDKSF